MRSRFNYPRRVAVVQHSFLRIQRQRVALAALGCLAMPSVSTCEASGER